jgi:heme oxygenase (mycobilin-producing)
MTRDPKVFAGASSSSLPELLKSVSEDIKPVEGGPVTFINVFEVPVEQIDTFIAHWRELAKIMSTAPGFCDTRLHRALSSQTRFQIVNVAHWDSRQAWEAATANPDFQERLRALAEDTEVQFSANPALYEIVVANGDHEQEA